MFYTDTEEFNIICGTCECEIETAHFKRHSIVWDSHISRSDRRFIVGIYLTLCFSGKQVMSSALTMVLFIREPRWQV